MTHQRTITKVKKQGYFTTNDSEILKWKDEKNVRLFGYWFRNWAFCNHELESIDAKTLTIRVKPPFHSFGYWQGQQFYAFNLLCELDDPEGQWLTFKDNFVGKDGKVTFNQLVKPDTGYIVPVTELKKKYDSDDGGPDSTGSAGPTVPSGPDKPPKPGPKTTAGVTKTKDTDQRKQAAQIDEKPPQTVDSAKVVQSKEDLKKELLKAKQEAKEKAKAEAAAKAKAEKEAEEAKYKAEQAEKKQKAAEKQIKKAKRKALKEKRARQDAEEKAAAEAEVRKEIEQEIKRIQKELKNENLDNDIHNQTEADAASTQTPEKQGSKEDKKTAQNTNLPIYKNQKQGIIKEEGEKSGSGNISPTPPVENKRSAKAEKAKAVVKTEFPTSPDQVEIASNLGGSTGAKLVKDKDGNFYIMKKGGNAGADPAGHLRNECAVDAFYRNCGANVPEFKLYETDNGLVKLARHIPKAQTLNEWWEQASPKQRDEMKKELRKDFAIDILTGNWDVIGMNADNILIDQKGIPWRIDNGGAFGYRAQGAKKAPQQWQDGWPDDVWTMIGRGKDIGNNAPSNCPDFMGDIELLDMLNDIHDRNWSTALQNMPDEEKVVISRRLYEIEKLAKRGNDFKDNGHAKSYTDGILQHSYMLTKEDIHLDIESKIECAPRTNLPTQFGRFRTNTSASGSNTVDWQKVVPPEDEVKVICQEAIDYVNLHFGPGGDNQKDVNISKEISNLHQQISAYATTGTDSAKHYQTIINKITEAYWDEAPLTGETFDFSVPLFDNLPKAKPASKYSSFTDHVFDYIKRTLKKDHGVDFNVDDNFITQWQETQGKNSYWEKPCKLKVARLVSLGYDISDQTKLEAELTKNGIYFGKDENGNKVGNHYDYFAEVVDNYLNGPPEVLQADVVSLQQYHVAIQLALEECDFEGNDHRHRDIILLRTENDNVVKYNPKKDLGKKCTHHTGINESHSAFTTVQVEGTQITIVRVPYSRITAIYFAERIPGSGGGSFLEDSENEFNAYTAGLDIYYCGEYSGRKSKKNYYKHLPKRK